jgi:hypothetical protein
MMTDDVMIIPETHTHVLWEKILTPHSTQHCEQEIFSILTVRGVKCYFPFEIKG